jgi:hypothetical protein
MRGWVIVWGLLVATVAGSARADDAWVEGKAARVLLSVLTPPRHDKDASSRITIQKIDGSAERAYNLPLTWQVAYAARSLRFVLIGIGEIGASLYVIRIVYLDEAKLTLKDSATGYADDRWTASAVEISDDGEYLVFVAGPEGQPRKLQVLKTSTDTKKTLGPPPPPVPMNPDDYDRLPKTWRDESLDHLLQLKEGMVTFVAEDTLKVVYGDPKKIRAWDLARLFASAK